MEFLDAVMDYFDAHIDMGSNQKKAVKVQSPSLGSGNSVAIRSTPSAPIDYIQNYNKESNFQVLVKQKDQLQAQQILDEIVDRLHMKNNAIQGQGFRCILLRCYTLPNWVETTEDGYYIYTALFNAEIEI